MPAKNKFEERRKHKRYMAHKDTFVVAVEHNSQTCKVLDISMDGLAYNYIASDKKIKGNGSRVLDMFMSGNGFYLKNIKYKIVYEKTIQNKKSFRTIIVKKRGVQFEGLTDEMKLQLNQFIRKFADD